MEKRLFTSECVTVGHPDKVADSISDAILDECLRQDPASRVACETMVTTNFCLICGEITTKALVDYAAVARETIRAITAAVDIPVVAIGGISHDNILELKNCGLDGVAVVSALFAQADVKAAAEELLRLSEEIAR